jgi:hypothetical protein
MRKRSPPLQVVYESWNIPYRVLKLDLLPQPVQKSTQHESNTLICDLKL